MGTACATEYPGSNGPFITRAQTHSVQSWFRDYCVDDTGE